MQLVCPPARSDPASAWVTARWRNYLRRAEVARLSWPLPEGLDDETLERRLFSPTPPAKPSGSTLIRPVASAFATAVWLTPRCAA